MKPVLKDFYQEVVVPSLMKELSLTNVHEVPKIEKVVINSGINANEERKWIDELASQIALLSGQKALITKAKVSISNFKLREGMPIGVKVTLRGNNMHNFLYKLINICLPLIRDFRGLNAKFDGKGNFTLGIKDYTIFPEINSDAASKRTVGMDITIVTTATTDQQGFALLKALGVPFRTNLKK